MNKIKVLHSTEINEGEIKKVEINGKYISIAYQGGEFYAFDDKCTHEDCSLSGGYVEEGDIVCPCHGAKFDMSTGKVKALPAIEDLGVYDTEVDADGYIYVCFE